MTTAVEIAKYVLVATGHSMTGKRLQKLVYFCDAWHVTALDRALTTNEPEAWEHGPVYSDVWGQTRYAWAISPIADLKNVEMPNLDEDSKQIIDAVLTHYSRYSDSELINLAHEQGSPWARVYERRMNHAISHESMRQYYSGVIARNEARPALPVAVYDYVLQEDMDEIEASLEDSRPAPGLVSMLVKAKTGT